MSNLQPDLPFGRMYQLPDGSTAFRVEWDEQHAKIRGFRTLASGHTVRFSVGLKEWEKLVAGTPNPR